MEVVCLVIYFCYLGWYGGCVLSYSSCFRGWYGGCMLSYFFLFSRLVWRLYRSQTTGLPRTDCAARTPLKQE